MISGNPPPSCVAKGYSPCRTNPLADSALLCTFPLFDKTTRERAALDPPSTCLGPTMLMALLRVRPEPLRRAGTSQSSRLKRVGHFLAPESSVAPRPSAKHEGRTLNADELSRPPGYARNAERDSVR